MRILYHHRTASRDGQEVHIRELIGALRGQGHEVLVVGPGGDPLAEPREKERMGGTRGGVARLRALVPDALMPLATRAWSKLAGARLVKDGERFRPDVLYERHALDNAAGAAAAQRLRVPLLLEVNAPLAREEHEQGKNTALEPALSREVAVLRRASAVLAVTGVLRDILIADGVAAERVHVVHNGASRRLLDLPRDPSLRGRLASGEGPILGFVGFPRPWHGLERVLAAMAADESGALSRAVFCVAGEGPSIESLRKEAGRLGVLPRVRFMGVLGRDDVVPFLDAIDVGLQPAATRYASPLKLFEYLARRVPVLAPRQDNIAEIVEHERSALLFDPTDPDDFTRGLRRLTNDDGLRSRIGEGGRRRLEEAGFTWERNAERVVAIARQSLDGRRS